MPEGESTTAKAALQHVYRRHKGGLPTEGPPPQEQRHGARVGGPKIRLQLVTHAMERKGNKTGAKSWCLHSRHGPGVHRPLTDGSELGGQRPQGDAPGTAPGGCWRPRP